MKKTPEKIKKQIEFWFLKYYDKTELAFTGRETFTLFDVIPEDLKEKILGKIELRERELPVLILTVEPSNHIINTTERFININDSNIEVIEYAEFAGHRGFVSRVVHTAGTGKNVSVKQDGAIVAFKLIKRSGKIIEWNIPTGKPGYAFWSVTKRCELIGRKYEIEK